MNNPLIDHLPFTKHILYISLLSVGLLISSCKEQPNNSPSSSGPIISKIWDKAPHNAFTDLVRFNGYFYVTHREGTGHVPAKDNTGDGKIRVIRSKDGSNWNSVALLEKDQWDLRDSKLSITPEGNLMIIMGASDYDGYEMKRRMPHVAFSEDGETFTIPQPVNIDPTVGTEWDWIWRVSWHNRVGYGVTYQIEPESNFSKALLLKTQNGVDYEKVTQLDVSGLPNEATIRFGDQDIMYMIIRRERDDREGYIGYSYPPYTQWKWNSLNMRIGGPDFCMLPDEKLIMGSRVYPESGYYTALFEVDTTGRTKELLQFESGGDTSYPGMLWEKDTLYFSYYSSHEDKTSIYFAKISQSIIENQRKE